MLSFVLEIKISVSSSGRSLLAKETPKKVFSKCNFVKMWWTALVQEPATKVFINIADNTQTHKSFVSWVTVWVFSAQSPI